MLIQCVSNPRDQPNELKVAAHQFQPAARSELFVTELDRKLSLDRPPQPPYLQPHLWGLSCRLELRCCRTPNDAPEAPFLRSNRRIDQNYFRFKVRSRLASGSSSASTSASMKCTSRPCAAALARASASIAGATSTPVTRCPPLA